MGQLQCCISKVSRVFKHLEKMKCESERVSECMNEDLPLNQDLLSVGKVWPE